MGKGRYFRQAMSSKITPTLRWAPKPNKRARCMGMALKGGPGGVANFIKASDGCKVKGK